MARKRSPIATHGIGIASIAGRQQHFVSRNWGDMATALSIGRREMH
jgi:hypothetical protein